MRVTHWCACCQPQLQHSPLSSDGIHEKQRMHVKVSGILLYILYIPQTEFIRRFHLFQECELTTASSLHPMLHRCIGERDLQQTTTSRFPTIRVPDYIGDRLLVSLILRPSTFILSKECFRSGSEANRKARLKKRRLTWSASHLYKLPKMIKYAQ